MRHLKFLFMFATAFVLEACVTGGATAGSFESPLTAAEMAAPPLNFELDDVNTDDGAAYRSVDHSGKPILLDFYFASCPACQSNAGNVEAAADRWHGPSGQVLQITIDCEQDEWDRWIDRYDVATPVLNDCERGLAGRLGVRSYPTTIVLNPDHTIAYRFVGVWTAAAKARITQLMAR